MTRTGSRSTTAGMLDAFDRRSSSCRKHPQDAIPTPDAMPSWMSKTNDPPSEESPPALMSATFGPFRHVLSFPFQCARPNHRRVPLHSRDVAHHPIYVSRNYER